FGDVRPGDGQVQHILARTAVFAFPTEIDAFPLSVLEAMAAGVPVVSNRLHALGDIVDDGTTGLLVEPDDEQLATAIESLIDDPGRRARMGAAGRARVERLFDARVTTAQLVTILREAQVRFAARETSTS